MSLCSRVKSLFEDYISGIDIEEEVKIDKQKDKPLRYNVWGTTAADIVGIFTKKGINTLPKDSSTSAQILAKVEGALLRINDSVAKATEFMNDIINDEENNIAHSIAMHELMESVKGEADKARNLGIDMTELTNQGVLPALPMARIAASIGRKITFQTGHRFKSDLNDPTTAAEIEELYYSVGKKALLELEKKGYVELHSNLTTIKDYIDVTDVEKSKVKVELTTDKALSVTLNERKLFKKGRNKDGTQTEEAKYFLNRTAADLTDTKLGVITDALSAVRQITQPSTIVLPETAAQWEANKKTKKDLRENDDPNIRIDKVTENARKRIYDTPVFVNNVVDSLMSMLNKEVLESGESASKIVTREFNGDQNLISVDKKESISGQNLSKTTPLDDLAENYNMLQTDGARSPLHMAMKIGRNARLYYQNSVLNPHGSKASRYMLTAGEYMVDSGSPDFDRLVYSISQSLGDKTLTYDNFTGAKKSKLDAALERFAEFESDDNVSDKIASLSNISLAFPGVDYATLLTTMKAIQDIRNPEGGKVTTEFMDAADATASGGTQTFLQALGTKPEITGFLERLGMLKNEAGEVKITISDLYGIMSESIGDYLDGKRIKGLVGQDMEKNEKDFSSARSLMAATVDLMFNGREDIRELSKDPTMTFVYGQGKKGATETMARKLADRIIDNMDNENVRSYMVELFGESIDQIDQRQLNDTQGLYDEIIHQLNLNGLPDTLYNILDASIKKQYLKDFNKRSVKVFELVKKIETKQPFKVLPAGAILSGVKTHMLNQLQKFGMPLTKVMEVSNPVPGTKDTVLTRRQKLTKAVADVSTIHGIDAAQLYHALDKVMEKHGVVVVHDEIRGTVQQVAAMEAEYRAVTLEIVKKYDIHQQIMFSIFAYDPELAKTEEYTDLMKQINDNVAEKAKIIADQFNDKTDALIGDGEAYVKFAKGKKETYGVLKTPRDIIRSEIKADRSPTAKYFINKFLTKVAPESAFLTRFLKVAQVELGELTTRPEGTAGVVLRGESDSYTPSTWDEVSISGTDPRQEGAPKLDLNNPADVKMQAEIIDHEIIHAYTIPFIKKLMDGKGTNDEIRNFKYLEKALVKIGEMAAKGELDHLSDRAQARLKYVFAQNSGYGSMTEFTAIMGGEPETANEIYAALPGKMPAKTLKARIEQFYTNVKKYITQLSDTDLLNEVDADLLQLALMNTITSGVEFRESKSTEFEHYVQQGLPAEVHGITASTRAREKAKGRMSYLNYAVASMLNSQLESNGKKLVGNLHENMKRVFPLYTDAAEKMAGLYEGSKPMQQLMHTITGEGVVNKTKKADILSKFAKVMGMQSEVMNNQMGKFNKLLAPLSKEERETIGRFVSSMPLHDYFELADKFKTEAAIAAEVAKLEKEIAQSDHNAIRDVNALIEWNVEHKNENSTGRIFNLETSYNNGEFGTKVRKLLALKSIQTIGSKDFEKFLENTDLVNLVKDSVIANQLSLKDVEGSSELLTDSLVMEYYKEPFKLKAITKEEFAMFEYGEDTGWKVLQAPSKTTLGIVYQPIIDSTSIPGAYTDIKLNTARDITVEGKKVNYDNVVEAPGDTNRLRLTRQNKLDLGLVTDFSQGLVRGTAHNMAVQESQWIRDQLIKKDTRMFVGNKQTDLENIIKSENVDNPWFLKMEDGVVYNDMSDAVKAKYMQVGKRVSNVGNFHEEVDLVRKDISHWLMGGNAQSLVTNPKFKWAMRITKDLIAGAKIGMVVMNPMKIARDNISNVSYLGVMGVNPLFIAKNYKRITTDYQAYTDLQRQLIQLQVRSVAHPNSAKIKKQIKTLQNRLARNPLGVKKDKAGNVTQLDLLDKGFINSLGSDLVAKNADTLSGLQADSHAALEYLLLNKDGNKNYIGHFMTQIHKLGFEGEDFLTYIGKLMNKTASGKGAQAQLDEVAARLKEIRTEEDIVNYVSQYTNSPASEGVRMGSAATDLTDVLAKETFYRHLVENDNLSPEAARIKVLDSFPDYKENMPLAIKQMSDMGVIMFPSFWLRIQKVIYRMMRDKPINLSTELMLEEAFGSNINTILDANIVSKSTSFGGIIHSPTEPIGAGSILPLHLFQS